uniref:Uncharacterized protein n=1 Tax=Tetradesmus obliquus TaxID=3088 RepID=A0A383VFB4_TETOB|eukprot:jgi/Sobl393_1/16384/SZX63469.1
MQHGQSASVPLAPTARRSAAGRPAAAAVLRAPAPPALAAGPPAGGELPALTPATCVHLAAAPAAAAAAAPAPPAPSAPPIALTRSML